jgi:hypothetical protein
VVHFTAERAPDSGVVVGAGVAFFTSTGVLAIAFLHGKDGARSESVAAPALIAPVQDDLMALLDQELGRHETEAVR